MNYNYNRNLDGDDFITSTLNIMPDFIRYPPTSKPPQSFDYIHKMKTKFVENGASMLPKLQNFNHMYQNYASGLIKSSTKLFPPGHPLYTKQESLITLKEENEKLKQENLDLQNKLKNKTEKTERL